MRCPAALATVAVAGLLAVLPPAAFGASDADALRAGAASADITPPIGTPMFAYTARSAIAGGHVDRPMQIVADPDQHLYAKSFVPSEGIHQRVKSRAIVLERGGEKFALVQADLGGVPYALTQEVARRIASSGIDEENILLSATHTHSSTGPIWPADNGGYAALGGDLFDPRIFELTAQGIAEAVLRADGRLEPAQLGVGTTELRGASRNRAREPFELNKDLPEDEDARERASVDPGLTVVRVDDRKGRPMALWSNFALHQTSLGDGNLLFSGDNAGITEELVETELGRKAKGREVVNVWTNGNEGDISPNGGADKLPGDEAVQYVNSDFGAAYMAGKRVATGVLRAWDAAGEDMTEKPRLGARRSFLTFDGTTANGEPVGPQAVLGAGVVQGGMCAPVENMAGPGQGMKFPGLVGVGLVPNVAPVSMWNVAGLGVAAFPTEITKQMGERIRRGLADQAGGAFDRVVVANLTNSYNSYASTPEEYDACQYEGSFTLFGRQQGARMLDFAKSVNAALLEGGEAPAGGEPPATALGTTQDAPPRSTPEAGAVVKQPAATVARTGQATFSWEGGDPGVDAPRGADFVRVQRRDGKGWRTVLTDASFRDATARAPGDVYTETVQFTECDPAGTYRILVTGRAEKGSGVEPYEVASSPFTLQPATLSAGPVTVADGVARVRATYPEPKAPLLMALPRIVQTGVAELLVVRPGSAPTTVLAKPDEATGTFSAAVPAGSVVTVKSVRDACGNTT